MTKDMTQGKPLPLLLHFMLPVLIGNLFQNFYSVIDSIIVGRYLGVNALAAVGSVGIVVFGVQGLAIGMTGGFGIVFSHSFGGKQMEMLRHYIAVAAYLCAAMSVVITAVLVKNAELILKLMHTPDEIRDTAFAYTFILFCGFPVTMGYNYFASIARAVGDSKTPLYFLNVSSCLNVFLDIILIRDFDMGVEGAAIATNLAQLVSSLLCGIYLKWRYSVLQIRKTEARFSWKSACELLKIGIPMALQFCITALGGIIIQSVLNCLGAAAIAANATAQRIGQVIQQAGVAMGTALATYVGQNAGAGNNRRVIQGVWQAFLFTTAVFGVLMILCRFYGAYVGMLFLSEPNREMQELMEMYFQIATWAFIPLGWIFIYRNALQGLGDGLFPMLGGIFELLGRIAVIVCVNIRMGFKGICLADAVAWVVALLPLIPAYYIKINRWKGEICD